MLNPKLRDDMMFLLGQIESMQSPILWDRKREGMPAYYDLIDSIRCKYVRILGELTGYLDE